MYLQPESSWAKLRVLLVDPPAPPPAALSAPTIGVSPPSWALLCLDAYLRNRTAVCCQYEDMRFTTDLEGRWVALAQNFAPDIVVIHVPTHNLAGAAALLDVVKRRSPSVTTVVCGPYPSQFPKQLPDLGRADYALAGDPEPILRDLLEFHNLPRRQLYTPGLLARWMMKEKDPYWLKDLRELCLPDWNGVPWSAYRNVQGAIVAFARISRGHTREPADRAFGDHHEPLRLWPMDRLAACIQKSVAQGVNEVFMADPPAVWSPRRLAEWCQALIRVRNTQSWSFQMLPAFIAPNTQTLLSESGCSRVEFLFPTTQPETLANYGCYIEIDQFRGVIASLLQRDIDVRIRFWLAGPESDDYEPDRIYKILKALDGPPAYFEPYPFYPDAPIWAEHQEAQGTFEAWLRWIQEPWTQPRTLPYWQGERTLERAQRALAAVRRRVRRDPKNWWRRVRAILTGKDWVEFWQQHATAMGHSAVSGRSSHQRSK